jgi:hypothetical protein
VDTEPVHRDEQPGRMADGVHRQRGADLGERVEEETGPELERGQDRQVLAGRLVVARARRPRIGRRRRAAPCRARVEARAQGRAPRAQTATGVRAPSSAAARQPRRRRAARWRERARSQDRPPVSKERREPGAQPDAARAGDPAEGQRRGRDRGHACREPQVGTAAGDPKRTGGGLHRQHPRCGRQVRRPAGASRSQSVISRRTVRGQWWTWCFRFSTRPPHSRGCSPGCRPGFRPLVVDNGSRDGSAEIAGRLGARVIHEPCRGFGAACHAGLLTACTEVFCFMDCDGSLDPSELPRVARPVERGEADLALGARRAEAGPSRSTPGSQTGRSPGSCAAGLALRCETSGRYAPPAVSRRWRSA